jgi:hypothetical protein
MYVPPPPPPPPPPQSEASATDYQTPAQTISSSSGSSEEIDYSGQKARVNSLRDEGRSNYISGNYSESITHFTRAIQTQYQGIKTLEESKDHMLAVLHGNRAAALMMVALLMLQPTIVTKLCLSFPSDDDDDDDDKSKESNGWVIRSCWQW